MNVIWIVADTFRRDHIGAYGNPTIRTPALDGLAARSVRFDGHYAAGFPTYESVVQSGRDFPYIRVGGGCPPGQITKRDAGRCPSWGGNRCQPG